MTRIIPFLETFWGLADERPEVRVKAAQSLLVHCFQFQSKSNKDKNNENQALDEDEEEKSKGVAIVDCAYALRRLLDGLNSGRASARQGFASCLSSFLRLAFVKDAFSQIRAQMEADAKAEDIEDCEFLRKDLQERTKSAKDPRKSKQRKKGSEERDGAFGRLFGILAISRSGILSIASTEVVTSYFSDVISLYKWRKWMREPCAHAIIEILESLLSSENGKQTAKNIVESLIIPEFLRGDNESQNPDFAPEALGVAIFVERQFNLSTYEKDKRLILNSGSDVKQQILTAMTNTTSATSIIIANSTSQDSETNNESTQRRHLLWKQIQLLYSSIKDEEQCKILSFIFQSFLTESIFNSSTNLTAERRTLALALVMDYTIPSEGLIPTPEMIFNYILTPQTIQKLFLNTISASGGHILKQMATHVLSHIVNSCLEYSEENKSSLPLTLMKAFIIAEPKFDSRTKSSTVLSLSSTLDKEELFQYMEFLQQQILKHALDSVDSSESLVITEGFLNLLSNLPKTFQNNALETDITTIEEIRRNVLGFLIAGAFFECKNLIAKTKKTKRKSTQKSDSSETYAVTAARTIQKSCVSSSLSYPIRRMLSSKFFTSLSDFITSVPNYRKTSNTNKDEEENKSMKVMSKSEYAFQTLTFVLQQSNELEQNKAEAYKYSSQDNMDEEEEDDDDNLTMEEARKQMIKLQDLAKDLLEKERESCNGKNKAIIGCTTLLMSLYVQLFHCGSNELEESGIQDEEEQEEEEEVETTEELIKDLIHATNSILDILNGKSKPIKKENEDEGDEESNPLALLADVCVATLSLFDKTSSSSRSTKILRETTKMAWAGTLIAAASTENGMKVDKQIADIMLESVCGNDISSTSNDDNEDVEMEDIDSDSNDEDNDDDAEAFNKAMETGLSVDGSDIDDKSNTSEDSDNKQGDQTEEEDIELDPAQLQNLLLEDNDLDSNGENEFQLEHHEGADAALAQLIKLKQETRKNALEEKERIEFTHRLRCVQLLESLFSSHGIDNNSNVFESESVVLMMLMPLLKTRRKLEKAIANEKNTRRGGASNEKKSLLEKISSLFKNKVCKTKSFTQADHAMLESTMLSIFGEAKKSLSLGHCSCCSFAFLLIIHFAEDFIKRCELVRKVYEDAAEEWSTRRATKLHGVLFDDIITRFPGIAKVVLVPFVTKAAQNGRSAFLKAEAFRYLSMLYNVPSKAQEGDSSSVDEKASTTLQSSASEAIAAINSAIEDEEFTKAKRVRDLLKASEKITQFCVEHSQTISTRRELSTCLSVLSSNLTTLSEKTQSSNIKTSCENLIKDISDFEKKVSSEVETNEVAESTQQSKTPKSTKKKKKKGKGKKGKK